MYKTSVKSVSRVWHPIASIHRIEMTGDKQDNVHYPPDANSTQCQQLAYCCSNMTQNESVHAEESQQDGIEQSGHEIITSVSDYLKNKI